MALLLLPGFAQADVTAFHCVDLNFLSNGAPLSPPLIAIRIGYINDSDETVTIPLGSSDTHGDNYFTPPPHVRSEDMTTAFLPGVHERAFTFIYDTTEFGSLPSGTLKWRLRAPGGDVKLLSITHGPEDYCSGGVRDLVISPSGVLFAATAEAGVYRSTDDGISWHAVNTGLGDLHVHALGIHPSDASILFAGTDKGVYKSVDGGDTWQAVSSGLPGINTP